MLVGGWRYSDIFIIVKYFVAYAMDRNKERKAEGKKFNQMVAKWLNRSAFGWGTLYLASRMLGA
jgi:hypothetical protein